MWSRGGTWEQRIVVGHTVNTRRDDRLTGDKNRAQWIVRGIREGFVHLVSVGDSGSCGECVPSTLGRHLRLYYASTEGDTADGSVVGSNVDAAGLYVGLTCGRAHNSAIVVA